MNDQTAVVDQWLAALTDEEGPGATRLLAQIPLFISRSQTSIVTSDAIRQAGIAAAQASLRFATLAQAGGNAEAEQDEAVAAVKAYRKQIATAESAPQSSLAIS
ncbi:MAG TPA: hypothetical protein VGN91_14960 [Bosea sp. (in: a-proteobacteria)]|jgi:hypothetical protein|nr:hypothetical protein [Bosea sp. (in: a-proteobacteria)]